MNIPSINKSKLSTIITKMFNERYYAKMQADKLNAEILLTKPNAHDKEAIIPEA